MSSTEKQAALAVIGAAVLVCGVALLSQDSHVSHTAGSALKSAKSLAPSTPSLEHSGFSAATRVPAVTSLVILDCDGTPVHYSNGELRRGEEHVAFQTGAEGQATVRLMHEGDWDVAVGSAGFRRAVLDAADTKTLRISPILSGSVRGVDGRSIGGIVVIAAPTDVAKMHATHPEALFGDQTTASAESEPDGSYAICDLPSGRWTLFAGGNDQYAPPSEIVITGSEPVSHDFQLRSLLGCAFRLRDPGAAQWMLAGATSEISTYVDATFRPTGKAPQWREIMGFHPSMILAGVPELLNSRTAAGWLVLFDGDRYPSGVERVELSAVVPGYKSVDVEIPLLPPSKMSQRTDVELVPIGPPSVLAIYWRGAGSCLDTKLSTVSFPLLLKLTPRCAGTRPFELKLIPSSEGPQIIEDIPAGSYSMVLTKLASMATLNEGNSQLELRAGETGSISIDATQLSCIEFLPVDEKGDDIVGKIEVHVWLPRTAHGRAYHSVQFKERPYLIPFVRLGANSFRLLSGGYQPVDVDTDVATAGQRYAVPVQFQR